MAMDMSVGMRIAASVTGGSSVDDLRKSVDKLNSSANSIQGAFKNAGTLLKGFIGLEAIRQMADYAMNIVKTADHLDELSERTGVAATTLSSLEKSAKQSGVSLDSIATGMKKLSMNLVEAQNGSKEAQKGFAALRLDPRQFKTSEEALYAIAERFKDMEDGANKVAIAQALMGKSGEANIPWLNNGAEAMRKYGSTFTPEMISMSAKFSDLVDEIGFNSKKTAASAVEKLLPTLSDILKSFNDLTGTQSKWVGFFDVLSEGFRLVAASAQIVIANLRIVFEYLSTVMSTYSLVVQGKFSEAGDRITEGFNNAKNVWTQGYNQAKSLMKDSLLFGEGSTEEILRRQRERAGAFDQKKDGSKKFTPDMSKFDVEGGKKLQAELEKIEKFRIEQEKANQKRMDEVNAVDMTTVEYQKMTAARELDAKVAEMQVGMSDAGKKKLREVSAAIKDQTAAMIELEYQSKRTFEFGAKDFFKTYVENATNTASQVKNALSNAFKGAEDAMLEFLTTGKLNFTSFATSILKDMARIMIQQQIMAPLAKMFGGFVTSMFTSSPNPYNAAGYNMPNGESVASANGNVFMNGSLQKFAVGGIVSRPTMFPMANGGTGLMGEAGAEAIMPLRRGADGKLGVMANGNSGNVNNVTVNVAVDGSNTNVQSDSTEAERLGGAISKAVQAELIKQQRPGGLLYAR